jgi:hypothetical protein
MSTRRLVASAVGLMSLGLADLIVGQLHPSAMVREARAESQLPSGPLTITASEHGAYFRKGFSWDLHVDPNGKAILTIDSVPNSKRREFTVPKKQLDKFRKVLAQERFFELGDSYGELVSDSSTTTITVSVGKSTKTVKVLFLMNWALYEPAKLREPSRAVRVQQLIRGWFNDPDAVDLRPYNRDVLDAVKRLEAGGPK